MGQRRFVELSDRKKGDMLRSQDAERHPPPSNNRKTRSWGGGGCPEMRGFPSHLAVRESGARSGGTGTFSGRTVTRVDVWTLLLGR